jgi:UDP-N-acetylglucosamine--N-acetylmuramyl-(pentapeptide) pyrophosphoryl-undecaprenol N-acetylglucosamine transferase
MNKRILIMAGGTGGHIFPALAVANELRERGWIINWLGSKTGLESRIIPENNIEFECLNVEGIRGKNLGSKLKACWKLFNACLESRRILTKLNPNIVLGMGGFVSFPGGLMAKLLGIPLIIHEQNCIPGTTNLILAKIAATKILEGFPDSFPKSIDAICTGNPLRKEFTKLPDKLIWNENEPRNLRILVVGGSQGAKILNEVVPTTLAKFKNLEIRHQTGTTMLNHVKSSYLELGVPAEVTDFIDNINTAYLWADLIICRAGAMTVSEVSAMGLPAIFIPLIHAIDDHQTANARFLTNVGAAILIPQTELNTDGLYKAILQVKTSLPYMSVMARTKARIDATHCVANICSAEAAL